jgi:hypothetical protein
MKNWNGKRTRFKKKDQFGRLKIQPIMLPLSTSADFGVTLNQPFHKGMVTSVDQLTPGKVLIAVSNRRQRSFTIVIEEYLAETQTFFFHEEGSEKREERSVMDVGILPYTSGMWNDINWLRVV